MFRLIFTAAFLLPLSAPAAAPAPPVPGAPPLDVKSYVLYDYDSGQVLADKDLDAHVAPASITKVMTTYIAFDEIKSGRLKPDDEVLISEKAWREGIDSSESRMFIEVGKKVAVMDLLRGVIIQSGNDASVALAEHIAGSTDAFATLMNQYAERLGLKNTHYTNPEGMPDPQHYSSARDIALLTAALIRNFPEQYKLFGEKEFVYNHIHQYNRNKLLWRDPAVDGVKTGHVNDAGYCLAASAIRDNYRLIAVVMGDASEEKRVENSLALLNYGFRFFEPAVLYGAQDPVTTVRAWKGTEENLPLGTGSPLVVSIPRGTRAQLKIEPSVPAQVFAPVAAGQALGELSVSLNGQELKRVPLVALKAVDEGNLWQRMSDTVRLWIGSK